MKTFDERLQSYFDDKKLAEDMRQAIKQYLGAPAGNSEEILADVDSETQEYFYDIDFECMLNNYENIFDNLELFKSLCGYYGTETLFVTENLEGISIKQS
ncbi:hypothetical protein D0324_13975 [Enterococcus faecalis]|nr:hypothetical protein [Enterococcus faecalis]